MKVSLKLASMCVLLAMAGSPAFAQTTWKDNWKVGFRAGTGLTDKGDQAVSGKFVAAITLEHKFGPGGSMFGEFHYKYYRSAFHEVTPIGSTGYFTNYATGETQSAEILVDACVDLRNDTLSSIGINLGYRQRIGASPFSWQAGVSINNILSEQEIIASYRRQRDDQNFRIGYTDTIGRHSISPGAFAGLRYDINELVYFEANVVWEQFKQTNFVPEVWTNQPASVETLSKSKTGFEVAFGIRF